ncbi:hypothetical protein GYO_0519 [Bacillus spizizenii TU-B-10]|uniref:Uncharacterized protein n=1 Tax=Bacillus spizizenii (strain DSM 15029 / JCM 12233 / NBRC 101239 / NRRL B-23049 / TU-B-10) TaxID=1052585 RepID=G4NTV1_BACS4|nr:hypothetical protein GYO_0519 [Bacillus spizizenii TU-B-10]
MKFLYSLYAYFTNIYIDTGLPVLFRSSFTRDSLLLVVQTFLPE